jgi:hypothetical protein
MKLGNQPSEGDGSCENLRGCCFMPLRGFDEHASRTEKSHQEEQFVHEKLCRAIADVEVTKKQEMLSSGITKASILLC